MAHRTHGRQLVSYRPKAGRDPDAARACTAFATPHGRVLYVGKAKNLRARLSNYFAPLHTLHDRTRQMVHDRGIRRVDRRRDRVRGAAARVHLDQGVRSAVQRAAPRTTSPTRIMAITLGDEAPRVIVTRNRRIPGARYFGPYPKVWAVRETIDLMLKAFPMRTLLRRELQGAMADRATVLAGPDRQMRRPVLGPVTIEEHRAIVDDFVAFMAGNDHAVHRGAHRADEARPRPRMDYESAARLPRPAPGDRGRVEKSAIVLPEDIDADLFGIAHDELAAAVQQFIVRGGRIRGVRG